MKLIVKPLVAVGIDPGTTMGYAVVGLDGRIMHIGSERAGSLSRLIDVVTYHGIPVLVGTDKAKCPDLVYQFSAKTGARIAAPPADLLVTEKQGFTRGFKSRNSHEMDALASALYAVRRYEDRLRKADTYLRQKGKERFSDEVKRILIIRDNIGPADALSIAEAGRKPKEEAMQPEAKEDEFSPTREDYKQLREKLTGLESEHRRLRQIHEELADELDELRKDEDTHLPAGSGNRRLNRIMRLREKTIRALELRLGKSADENLRYREFISQIGKYALGKRLANLSYDEFLRKDKSLRIGAGDILLVDEANSYSAKTLDALKGKVSIIIYAKPISSDIKSAKDILLVDGSLVRKQELGDFALLDKDDLEKARKDKNTLLDMLEKYREGRKRTN